MEKAKKKVKEKFDIGSIIIGVTTIVVLIVGVLVFGLVTKPYQYLADKSALGIVWAMIGFSFTVFCFMYPKTTKTIKIYDKFYDIAGKENYENIVGKKTCKKVEHMRTLISILKVLEFGVMLNLMLLTTTILLDLALSGWCMIVYDFLAGYVVVETFLSYTIIAIITTGTIDVLALDEEDYNTITESLRKLKQWKDEQTNELRNKEKGSNTQNI